MDQFLTLMYIYIYIYLLFFCTHTSEFACKIVPVLMIEDWSDFYFQILVVPVVTKPYCSMLILLSHKESFPAYWSGESQRAQEIPAYWPGESQEAFEISTFWAGDASKAWEIPAFWSGQSQEVLEIQTFWSDRVAEILEIPLKIWSNRKRGSPLDFVHSSKTCLACGLDFWEMRWDEGIWSWQKLIILKFEKITRQRFWV